MCNEPLWERTKGKRKAATISTGVSSHMSSCINIFSLLPQREKVLSFVRNQIERVQQGGGRDEEERTEEKEEQKRRERAKKKAELLRAHKGEEKGERRQDEVDIDVGDELVGGDIVEIPDERGRKERRGKASERRWERRAYIGGGGDSRGFEYDIEPLHCLKGSMEGVTRYAGKRQRGDYYL